MAGARKTRGQARSEVRIARFTTQCLRVLLLHGSGLRASSSSSGRFCACVQVKSAAMDFGEEEVGHLELHVCCRLNARPLNIGVNRFLLALPWSSATHARFLPGRCARAQRLKQRQADLARRKNEEVLAVVPSAVSRALCLESFSFGLSFAALCPCCLVALPALLFRCPVGLLGRNCVPCFRLLLRCA